MTESENNKSFSWGIVIGGPFLLLFLYIGAMGPITWLHSRGFISRQMSDVFEFIYSPLRILYENFDIARMFFDWYIGLFQ